MERLSTRKEILDLLPGLTNKALNRLMDEGRIPFVRANQKVVLFDAEAVVKALTVEQARGYVFPEHNFEAAREIESKEKAVNALTAQHVAFLDQIEAAQRDKGVKNGD